MNRGWIYILSTLVLFRNRFSVILIMFLCCRYPNTACELLTSDVSQINDALAGNEELVKKLYGFLDTEKRINPLLASFFSKVMGLLIARKSEMVSIALNS